MAARVVACHACRGAVASGEGTEENIDGVGQNREQWVGVRWSFLGSELAATTLWCERDRGIRGREVAGWEIGRAHV